MRIVLYPVLLCLLSCYVHAQNIRYPVSATYMQLHAYSSNATDPFSSLSNQAALASVKNIAAAVYGEKRFLLDGLAYYAAACTLPLRNGGLGLSANYFGGIDYNESSLSLGYGRNINNRLDIGLQFNYYSIKESTYGKTSSINFELGTIVHITDKIKTGFHIYNPTESKIGRSQEERFPFIYSLGFGYDPSSNLYMGCEMEKAESEPIDLRAGLHYAFGEKLFARVGVTTSTSSYYFGFGVILKEVRIDATATVHPYLGVTPGLLVIYNAP